MSIVYRRHGSNKNDERLKGLIRMMKASNYLEERLEIKMNKNAADMIDDGAFFEEFPSKHIIILLEGAKASDLYFIIHGVVRGYYIDDHGNDITKCFSSENEFFSSEGLRTEWDSSFTIECLEACKCIRLPYELVYKIMKEDENLNNLVAKYYLMEVAKLENRAKKLALMNAEERYIDFCRQSPQLNDRVELKYIASYIGIREASLSRIRKRMKDFQFN